MRPTRLVVIAWGNESRGDDALGPAFLAAAEAVPDPSGVTTTFVADFQLQPEHAVDLDQCDLALFVDASRTATAPFAFRRVEPARTATFTSHGVSPEVVLDAFVATFGRPPPPAFLLSIPAERFELGAAMGERASGCLDAALAFFAGLRGEASARSWQRAADACGAAAAHRD